jgi:hypothetical protein
MASIAEQRQRIGPGKSIWLKDGVPGTTGCTRKEGLQFAEEQSDSGIAEQWAQAVLGDRERRLEARRKRIRDRKDADKRAKDAEKKALELRAREKDQAAMASLIRALKAKDAEKKALELGARKQSDKT